MTLPNFDTNFPIGLLDWAGHRKGGVRRLFHDVSGRPAGQVIHTPLLSRLEEWARSSCTSAEFSNAVLLVGGPGNGKTEAVEFAIQKLDEALELRGLLTIAFSEAFSGSDMAPPPRLVKIDLEPISKGVIKRKIAVVQEGSATDHLHPQTNPAAILLTELEEYALCDNDTLYLACINRGVLDDALIIARDECHGPALKLLEQVVKSVSMGVDVPSCWPLAGFERVAVWPMDVDSLLLGTTIGGSPFEQMLSIATNARSWPAQGSCVGGVDCPYCFNRAQLATESEQQALVKILRWSELSTGKRWSFRDLFSLISFVLAGVPTGETQASSYEPCSWAARLRETEPRKILKPTSLQLIAPFLLPSLQYQHALFGKWDGPDSKHLLACMKNLRLESHPVLKGLRLFLAHNREASIPTTLAEQLKVMCTSLDPAVASSDMAVQLDAKTVIRFRDLDMRFSRSVADGLHFLKRFRCLTAPEKRLLTALSDTEEELLADEIVRLDASAAKFLRIVLRDFACRFVRRSIGVRVGIVRDSAILADYQKVVDGDPALINEAIKQVGNLLNTNGQFTVNLTTTFGEPTPPLDKAAVLSTDKQRVKVAPLPLGVRPASPVRFLIVGSGHRPQAIPLTYELFRSVRELANGLLPASLPRSVMALLDATRARMGGEIVRNDDSLNGAEITLGRKNETVVYELEQFVIRRRPI